MVSEPQTLLSRLAKEYSVNIVGGSAAVCNGSKIYNRSYTFDRSGSLLATYDKIHLFSPQRRTAGLYCGQRNNNLPS